MRRLLRAVMACAAIATPGVAAAQTPAPGWTVLADCAAAYLANARIADPGRPASMTAQVSDVASDYSDAAAKRRRIQLGGSVAQSRRAVAGRVARQAGRLADQSREAVERLIDACPQVGG